MNALHTDNSLSTTGPSLSDLRLCNSMASPVEEAIIYRSQIKQTEALIYVFAPVFFLL